MVRTGAKVRVRTGDKVRAKVRTRANVRAKDVCWTFLSIPRQLELMVALKVRVCNNIYCVNH